MKTFTTAAAALAASAFVSAAPLAKRAPAQNIDGVVLNYALTLEHLEANFYRTGLGKYSADDFANAGYEPWVRRRLTEIASHERTHVEFLETGLGAAGVQAVKECTYKFPDTDPKSFLAVAQILEGVGVSAYTGAAKQITDNDYLTAAASILAVEARHSAWIRSAVNKGDAFPDPFDTPLGFSQVYSLAAPFITECPSDNPALPVTAFPTLTLATTGTLKPGQSVKFDYENSTSTDFVVFISGLGQTAVPYSESVKIPEGYYGQIYTVITASNTTASDDTVKAGPAAIEVPFSPSKNVDYSS